MKYVKEGLYLPQSRVVIPQQQKYGVINSYSYELSSG